MGVPTRASAARTRSSRDRRAGVSLTRKARAAGRRSSARPLSGRRPSRTSPDGPGTSAGPSRNARDSPRVATSVHRPAVPGNPSPFDGSCAPPALPGPHAAHRSSFLHALALQGLSRRPSGVDSLLEVSLVPQVNSRTRPEPNNHPMADHGRGRGTNHVGPAHLEPDNQGRWSSTAAGALQTPFPHPVKRYEPLSARGQSAPASRAPRLHGGDEGPPRSKSVPGSPPAGNDGRGLAVVAPGRCSSVRPESRWQRYGRRR